MEFRLNSDFENFILRIMIKIRIKGYSIIKITYIQLDLFAFSSYFSSQIKDFR